MSKKLTFLFALAASLALSVPSAFACSCMLESPQENLARASAVFEGRVVKIEGQPGQADPLKITLSLVRVWKGLENEETVVATTAPNSAACGANLEQGTSYLVYASRHDANAPLEISLCSRTQPIASATEDLAVLGAGVSPVKVENAPSAAMPKGTDTPAASDGAQGKKRGCALAPGNAKNSTSAGLMLLFAALWFARRRRPQG